MVVNKFLMWEKCQKRKKMYEVRNVFLRLGIVLGMVVTVVTILYFTPMPAEYFLNCDRPCHHLDWPMICRIKMKIEIHRTMDNFCIDCPLNSSDCQNTCFKNTIRSILTTNNQIPGPSLHVCQNDILVVDVTNAIPGRTLTLHWRGQPQHEMPMMDGVPMVTQCSIPSYSTFQYKFRVTSPGTHLWHAHAGVDVADGIFGALVVRQPYNVDPHRKYYDQDLKEHVLVISETGGDLSGKYLETYFFPRILMINGASSISGQASQVLTVKRGQRYRFRIAYAGGLLNCPIKISLEGHPMRIVAVDGNPVSLLEVTNIELAKGERLEFIVKAKASGGTYPLRVTSKCYKSIEGVYALVHYEEEKGENGIKEHRVSRHSLPKISGEEERNFSTGFCDSKLGQICIQSMKSLSKLPRELRHFEIDKRIYLTINTNKVRVGRKGTVAVSVEPKIYSLNNITFVYPASPLLSQYDDISADIKCNMFEKPKLCHENNSTICSCVHIEKIPTGASVEVVIVDQAGDSDENVFHLHGYHFYVVGFGKLQKSLNLEKIVELDREGVLIKRNLASPVLKDTVRIPKYGVVSFRFIANNPGFWMLRDEKSLDWTRGMDVVFHVSSCCDMPSVPSDFPKCGDWIGPDFFLL